MPNDHDLLIRIDENVKCLPDIKEDIRRINGNLIQTTTKLNDHLEDKLIHSKVDSDSLNLWVLIKIVLKAIKILK